MLPWRKAFQAGRKCRRNVAGLAAGQTEKLANKMVLASKDLYNVPAKTAGKQYRVTSGKTLEVEIICDAGSAYVLIKPRRIASTVASAREEISSLE